MKRKIVTSVFCGLFAVSGALAQQTAETKQPMKIEVKEKNGETVLTITTEENGYPVEQVYYGEEAKAKLAELEGAIKEEGKQIEIEMTEVDGVKHLKVITKENGQETVEEFVGEAAEAKLKELEAGEGQAEKRTEEFKMQSPKPKTREKTVD